MIDQPDFLDDRTETNTMNNILNMDFNRNKDVSFQKTINLLTHLIGELDGKAKKIKDKKRAVACWWNTRNWLYFPSISFDKICLGMFNL